jgi:deazaflavin-dependent oxidoreductase (nitroreductase family)
MTLDLQAFTGEDFCYLTTTGRVSGRAHTIEIWYALHGHTVYMLSGGGDRADWVKNAAVTPQVTVKIRERVFAGTARPPADAAEAALARRLVGDKYQRPLDDTWRNTALPLAVDLTV